MMQYPRIPHDKKKSVKLKLDDIQVIQNLYNQNPSISLKKLAISFDVTVETIKTKIDPLFRQKKLDLTRKRLKWRYFNEPGYKERTNSCRSKRISERYDTDEDFRQYMNDLHKNQQQEPKTNYVEGFASFMRLVEQ